MTGQTVMDIPADRPLAIYGAGGAGSRFHQVLAKLRPDIRVECFLDSINAGSLKGKKIRPLDKFIGSGSDHPVIVVASAYWMKMASALLQRDITEFLIVDHDRLAVDAPTVHPDSILLRDQQAVYVELARHLDLERSFSLAQECLRRALHLAGDQPAELLKNLIFLVTLKCNLRCIHCWGNDNPLFESAKKAEMTTAQIKRVLDSVASLRSHPNVLLSGGEIFMRKDMDVVVCYAASLGLNMTLFTNGTFPDRLKILLQDKAVRRSIDAVAVSLDGPRDIHDAIRGKGVFDKAMKTFDILRDYGMNVGCNTIIQKSNMERIEEVWEIREQLQKSHGIPLQPFSVELDGAHYIELPGIDRFRPFLSEEMQAYIDQECCYTGLGCSAGTARCTLRSDGEVLTCAISEAVNNGTPFSLGNLADFGQDLKALLNSPKANRIRARIPACLGCASYCER